MKNMSHDILSILRKASVAVLEIYSDVSKFNTEYKQDQSPLTEADKKSNEIIYEGLTELYPGIPIISEESKQEGYHKRSNYHQYFLVDPLDGTKEFINRNGEFTINIAYLEGHFPVGGFVLVPVTGVAYLAEKGNGAFTISRNEEKSELRSKPFYLMDRGLKVVASRSHRDPNTDKIIAQLNEPEIVSSGSSLKFLFIAEGKANFYPRLGPTMEWDTAAAQCVLEESGGSVIRSNDLQPLNYNKEDLLNPHFMALGALLDPESLRKILH